MQLIQDAINIVDSVRPDIAAALRETPIGFEWLEEGTWAEYDLYCRRVTLAKDTGVDHTPLTVALDLIHEGTHALDHMLGMLNRGNTTYSRLIKPELHAKRVEMEYMSWYLPHGYPGFTDRAKAANQWLSHYRQGTWEKAVTESYRKFYNTK